MLRNRKNIRLKNFDYRSSYRHFITICTLRREKYFGGLTNEGLILSEIGQTAHRFWLEIPVHYSHVILDGFVIMPNHIHGIIKLDYSKTHSTGTCHGMSQLKPDNRIYNKFGRPLSGSVSMIINQYKSSVKRWCNKNGFESFAWQPRFYVHIINNRWELYRILVYIKSDPKRSFHIHK
jgi:REP element-mobilizing transposase RayT